MDVSWRRAGLVAVLAAAVFAGLLLTATAVLPWGRAVDLATHSWILSHRVSGVVSLAIVVTTFGTSAATIPAVVVAAVVVTQGDLRARLVRASAAVAVMTSGILARFAASILVGRARPPRPDWAYPASGFAFPSGHSTNAALAAGLVGWLIVGRMGRRGLLQVVTWLIAISYAVAVGVSRVYLGMHWPTDVVGGWAFAAAWIAAALSVSAVASRWDSRSHRGRGPHVEDAASAGHIERDPEGNSVDHDGVERMSHDELLGPRDRNAGDGERNDDADGERNDDADGER
jgi:membrane-associated phospholipid phosphatase